MSFKEDFIQFLNKNNIEITDYQYVSNTHNILYTKSVIYILREIDGLRTVGLSFLATLTPEIVTSNIVLMSEMPNIKLLPMESFVLNNQTNKYILGQQAYDYIHQEQVRILSEELNKQMEYQYMLDNYDGYLC